MKGKEYLENKEKVLDMRKTFKEQKTILTDCYYWKDVWKAIELEKEDILEKLRKVMKTKFNMKEKYIEELLELLS